jgi:rare lipoprotein A
METAPAVEETAESLFDEAPATQQSNVPAPTAPSAAPPSAAEPSMAPVEQISIPKKEYYVQAGMFGNPENAEKLSGKLSSVGLVESSPVTVKGRSFHRVRVGPFSSLQEANRALDQVKHTVPDARLILP